MFKKEKNGKTNRSSQKEGLILVFLFICIAIILLGIILFFSKIRIEIINFRFDSQLRRHINKDYKIIIKLKAFGLIPIFKINITKTKLEKMKLKEKIKNVDFKVLEDNHKLDKKILKAIKNLKLSIKNINLRLDIGTENATLTSIIVPAISTVIAIVLRKKVKKFENQIFMINPIYQNQNLVNLFVSGIFEIKMSHIINIIYILNKKEKKGVKEYERTSHRRSYGYGYE